MIDQLVEKIKKTKAPVVVGLDPMLSYICLLYTSPSPRDA